MRLIGCAAAAVVALVAAMLIHRFCVGGGRQLTALPVDDACFEDFEALLLDALVHKANFIGSKYVGGVEAILFTLNQTISRDFVQFLHEHVGGSVERFVVDNHLAAYRSQINKQMHELRTRYAPIMLRDDCLAVVNRLAADSRKRLESDLVAVESALMRKPNAIECWKSGSHELCELFKQIGHKIAVVVMSEARSMETHFEGVRSETRHLSAMIKAAYEACTDAHDIKTCITVSMRESSKALLPELGRFVQFVDKAFAASAARVDGMLTDTFNEATFLWEQLRNEHILQCIKHH